MKRRKILISAHEISPIQGSECAVGWNICTQLGRYHDVTVLAASGSHSSPNSYKEAISNYIDRNGELPGVRFVFVPQPKIRTILSKINLKLSPDGASLGFRPFYYFGYSIWQKAALEHAISLHRTEKYDLAHHLNAIGFREPGYLWRLGIPFLWGPVSGMYSLPYSFYSALNLQGRAFETFRRFGNWSQLHFSPRVRMAAKKAAYIWAVTEYDKETILQVFNRDSNFLLEAGTESTPLKSIHRFDKFRPLQICWSGHFTESKALPLLLFALHQLKSQMKFKLSVLGTGPLRAKWHRLACNLGLDGNIQWHGRIDRNAALLEMAKSDVLVSSSLREATSLVITEALSLGIPVLCHDVCGMSTAIDARCGIKVPFINPKESIKGFKLALQKLYNEPSLIEILSRGALRRASELSWAFKAEEIARVYDQVLSNADNHVMG